MELITRSKNKIGRHYTIWKANPCNNPRDYGSPKEVGVLFYVYVYSANGDVRENAKQSGALDSYSEAYEFAQNN